MSIPGEPVNVHSLERARADALRLLKFRPRSLAELTRRLAQKGYSPAVVEELLSEFKKTKLLDDARFAQLFAAHQMEVKPMGRKGLLNSLRAKGISEGEAAVAAEGALGEKSELERARELASQRISRLRGLDPQAVKRRLFGLLSRRGFSTDVVYRVVREATQ